MRRDDGDGKLRAIGLYPFDKAQAVTVGKLHVSQAQVEVTRTKGTPGGREVGGAHHLDVHAVERDAEQLADVGFVVDDERAWISHGEGSDFPALRVGEHDTENTTTAQSRLVDQDRAIALCQLAGDEE